MSKGITVEILVLKHATVRFVLCCQDLLKATVGIRRTAGWNEKKGIILNCGSEVCVGVDGME